MSLRLERETLHSQLLASWRHVQEKGSAPGLDGIDIEDFKTDADRQIRLLTGEMMSASYIPLPVRVFTQRKGDKERELGILCVRDRVAQHALAEILSTVYEPRFLPCSYAFRPGKSARQAVDAVCEWIAQGKEAAFRSDVDSYFDRIDHRRLINLLRDDMEESLVALVAKCIRLREMRAGIPVARTVGICQGAPLSPLLSNVYLHDFDRMMSEKTAHYLRYCDDFVCLTETLEQAKECAAQAKAALQSIKLSLKAQKTSAGHVSDGFSFLGYHFTDAGSVVRIQALESLAQSLERRIEPLHKQYAENCRSGLSDTSPDWNELADVLRGWLQYYVLPASFPERDMIGTAILALAVESHDAQAFKTYNISKWYRETVSGAYWPLFAQACAQLNQPALAVGLYEAWFGKEDAVQVDDLSAIKLFNLWKLYYFTGSREALTALTQAYSDLGSYALADLLYDQMNRALEYGEESVCETEASHESVEREPGLELDPAEATVDPPQSAEDPLSSVAPIEQEYPVAQEEYLPASPDIAQRILELFVDEKRYYGREENNPSAERSVQIIADSLTVEDMLGHLRGEYTLSTPLIDDRSHVTCVALDIDIIKKEIEDPATDLVLKKRDALHIAQGLMKKATRMGLSAILEDSGKRGYHVWLPIDGSIPLSDAVELTLLLVRGMPDPLQKGITIERIPNVKRVRPETKPRMLKLPCGRHPQTGVWCRLLREDGEPESNPIALLQSFAPNNVRHIRMLLWREKTVAAQQTPDPMPSMDIAELLPLSPGVSSVLEHCIVARALCMQAKRAGTLTHQERLHLLYIFAHMGDVGKRYLHQVMKWTYNYRYAVTQGHIDRVLDRPISCNRLRETYADRAYITACACKFPMVKGTYPSPVLHAYAVGEGAETTLPKANEDSPESSNRADAFNTRGRIRELANRVLHLSREKNRLEDDIKACQQELAVLFDMLNTDTFEIDVGMLTRTRRQGGGFTWNISIE